MLKSLPPHEIKVAKEASITLGGNAVGGILRYLFNIFVARFLGVEVLGFYAISNAATQVASVVGKLGLDLGVDRLARDVFGAPIGRSSPEYRPCLTPFAY